MTEHDPNSQEYWEKEMRKKGLPTSSELDAASTTPAYGTSKESSIINEDEFDKLGFAMQDVLADYATLPSKLRADILEDIKQQKQTGKSLKEVSERVGILIKKGHELDKMTSADSDRYYKIKKSAEELRLEEETDEFVVNSVDELLRKLEEMHYRNSENADGKKDGPNLPEPKVM
jgi:hypothetical protein